VRRQIVARLWHSLVVVFIVTTISFFAIHAAPGDPVAFEGRGLSPERHAQLREAFGYDKPVYEQYLRYVANVARGELGSSVKLQIPVADALAAAIPRTLLLAGLALSLTFVLGVGIGVLQATHAGRWVDRLSSTVLLWFYSLPDFWAAIMILLIFGHWWPILPAGHIVDPTMHEYYGPWDSFIDRLKHLVLPVASLMVLSLAGVSRFQRAAMLDALPSDFIRTARAKGLPEHHVIWRHALRTALTPMVTLLGLMAPAFLGGAVFVEAVFAWPGMGQLAANAVSTRDYDVVTATVIVGAVMVVIGNLIADLLHMVIDPRVRA
jgi:peptide/nickel transport system permease protein